MVFALIIASQKLQPYFQAHTIIVLSDQPMKRAMNKPDTARWLVLWVVELVEFNVKYWPWIAVKAQALVNFIVEFTPRMESNKDEDWWTVKVDGSSNKDAGGVGVILETPEKDIIQYAVRLQFPTTNNETKYEAHLTGLKLAKSLRAQKLNVYSDSQLVTRQVNDEYKAV